MLGNPPYIVSRFKGGLDMSEDPSLLEEGKYAFASNVRTRYGEVEPVQKHNQLVDGLPANGLYQGIYSVGTFLIAFINGDAYYKDCSVANSPFNSIPSFATMSAVVDYIYACPVPVSSNNFLRKLSDATDIGAGVKKSTFQTPHNAYLVCQDGINRPNLINSTADSRVAKSYNEWTKEVPEYIPIGKQMLYSGGILYLVSKDCKRLYRSVTGRGIDFMVAITDAGEKIDPLEDLGGAPVTAHAVDADNITTLGAIATGESGALFLSTDKNSYFVIPLLDDTIYGEPQFQNLYQFPVGTLNNFGFCDTLGDNALINQTGITSFNAAKQLQYEGKNGPFSQEIYSIFQGTTQDICCCISFSDYSMFAIKSVYGYVIAVYDNIRKVWVSIDQYSNIGAIKQFCVVSISGFYKLYFITATGLYEAFSNSAEIETAKFYLGDFASGNPKIEQNSVIASLVMKDVKEQGTLSAQLYTDGQADQEASQSFKENLYIPEVGNQTMPFGASNSDRIKNISFALDRGQNGYKIGLYVTWDFNARLLAGALDSNQGQRENSQEQQILEENANRNGIPTIISFDPINGPLGANVTLYGTNLQNVVSIYIGEVAVGGLTIVSGGVLQFVVSPGTTTAKIKIHTNEIIVESETDFTIV